MTTSIQRAAMELARSITAPRGAVNTYVNRDTVGPFICVMIDPFYWNSIYGIPDNYEGYRVFVEKREPTIAHH
jgi:hypothetical protein